MGDVPFRELVEAAPAIVFVARPEGSLAYVNPAWTVMSGHPAEVVLEGGWADVVHPDDAEEVEAAWMRAIASAAAFRQEFRIRDGAGDPRWVIWHAVPVTDAAGKVTAWYGTVFDVDARHTAESALRSLSDAIPQLVWINDALGNAISVNSRWVDYTGFDVGALFGRGWIAALHPDDVESALSGWVVAQSTGRFETDRPCRLRRRDGVYRWFVTHAVAVRDESGAIVRWYGTNTDVDDLYEREHRVAVTLQRALLPAVLPTVEGLRFDAVYYPGATDAEIGGDWYDAIALPDGRVLVSIGDVTGRGLTAAVIMGRTRQALETLATYELDPVRLLDSADAVLRRAHPDAIVTALVGVIDPASGTMTYATAGHPTPFVRATDGTIRRLPGRGLPLGLREGHHQPATTIALPPGSLTVFFTDGLVEATRDIDDGERRLVDALGDPAVAEGRAPAAALVARVLDEAIRDDVAVLTVRVADTVGARGAWTVRWSFDARESARAHDVRDAVVETLVSFGTNVDLAAAQLVFAELAGNAVRHAPGTIDVVLRWDDPSAPVLEVIDDGPGFTVPETLPAPESESGRGLYLVSQLTREFTVTKEPGRGARARAVLR
jgi:PAS domain S-box-containing protein